MPASFKLIDPAAGEKGGTEKKIITGIQHFCCYFLIIFIEV